MMAFIVLLVVLAILAAFGVGVAVGYAIRSAISQRRRQTRSRGHFGLPLDPPPVGGSDAVPLVPMTDMQPGERLRRRPEDSQLRMQTWDDSPTRDRDPD